MNVSYAPVRGGGGLRQTINPWMGIALVGLMCFWVVLYYFVHKTDAFGFDFIQVGAKNEHRYLKAESVIYAATDASQQTTQSGR